MNWSRGFLRLTVIAYCLTAVGTLGAMFVYGQAPGADVNWFVMFPMAFVFVIPLSFDPEAYKGIVLELLWAEGPLLTFVLVVAYTIGACATGAWAIQHVAKDATLPIIALLLVPPFLFVGAVGLLLYLGRFMLSGFSGAK
jgi:hypothetical protein